MQTLPSPLQSLATASAPLVDVEGLSVTFPAGGMPTLLAKRRPGIQAVSKVSFQIFRGETLGLVGESGCGKSTTGRAIVQIIRPTEGHVLFEGQDLVTMNERQLKPQRRKMQFIFQDPYASLNPRMTVFELLSEPLLLQEAATAPQLGRGRAERERIVMDSLHVVGLGPSALGRYAHEFSGGQRQRIAIARALVLRPKLLVLDEPVSALDVSIQAQVLNLLVEIQREFGLTYLFIAHDLAVVRTMSDRVAVMYLGKIAEVAPAQQLYQMPAHPYTAGLLSAVPVPDPARRDGPTRPVLSGDLPSPANPPTGCRFHTRCPRAQQRCQQEEPALRSFGPGHLAACHFPLAPHDSSS